FAPLVNRAGGLWSAMGADTAGKGKLAEEFEHAGCVAALVRINLGVMAFEVGVGQRRGSAMAGAGDVHDIQVVLFDQAIQVDPDEGLAGIGSPVTQQAVLD